MNKNKKYKINYSKGIQSEGTTLYQITAIKNFVLPHGLGEVYEGEEGGLVENENNLSQEGSSWIHYEASAQGNSRVSENGLLFHEAKIYDQVKVRGNSIVQDGALLFGDIELTGNSTVVGGVKLDGQITLDKEGLISCG